MKARAQEGGGWRVPATELERAVAIAAKRMLEDKRLLVTALELTDLEAGQLASLLRAAEGCVKQLQSAAETDALSASLIERVELKPEGLRVIIKLPVAMAAPSSVAISITHEWPIQMRRRGVEKRLLIPGAAPHNARPDRALLKAVARAYRWLDDLISGRVASMTKIAAREGVGKRYVSRLIRLGLLAPEIVDLLAEGRQAPELTAQSLLTGEKEVALDWRVQKRDFGLAAQA
jgi:hypothetical protein